jgi:hypothetical protein
VIGVSPWDPFLVHCSPVRTRRRFGCLPLLTARGGGLVFAVLIALGTTSAFAASAVFRPARVQQVFRTTGFVVLPDLAAHLPKWIVTDYGFTARGPERVVAAGVDVYVNNYRARQAAIAIRNGRPLNGGICPCTTLRVGNVLLTLQDLEHVKPAPPPHYASDRRRIMVAALTKLVCP